MKSYLVKTALVNLGPCSFTLGPAPKLTERRRRSVIYWKDIFFYTVLVVYLYRGKNFPLRSVTKINFK